MVHEAVQQGYAAIVVNHLAPKGETTDGLKCMDFSQEHIMEAVFKFVDSEVFPGNKGIFGVGFSMGGNYLLKSVGTSNPCGFIAIATVA